MIYKDENKHSKGYHIQSGRRLSKTSTLKGFTNQGQHRIGYERKKKTQKTKETQYVDADEHPFQSRIFRNSGVSFNGKGVTSQ